jgi:hypothetical protein
VVEVDAVGLLLGAAGEPLEGGLGPGDVGEGGLLDGAAAVAGLDLGQLAGVGPDELGDLAQLGAALAARHAGPGALVERLAGGLDGPHGVVLAGLGHLGDGLARARVVGGERLAGGSVAELAPDEQLVVGHVPAPLGRASTGSS